MRARLLTVASVVMLIASACSSTPATPAPRRRPRRRADGGAHGGPDGRPHRGPDGAAHGRADGRPDRRSDRRADDGHSRSAPTTAGRPSVLRVARISDFLPSIHPVDLGTGNQELMADLVFNRLVDVDKDEVTILPSLATEWTASPDATVYTFKLYPNAVWSDGQPATADDVIFTIAWSAQNPTAFKQLGVEEWLNVKGADAVKGTKNIPAGVKKIDAQNIEITLDQPDATFLRRIAGAVYYILPQHILKDLTAAQAETCDFCLGVAGKTPGTGPYDFTTSISATGATLTAKKGYWKGKDGPDQDDHLQDPGLERLRRPAGGG